MIAHIAGFPVEETLLQFAPVGVAGLVAMRLALVRLVGRLRRHPGH